MAYIPLGKKMKRFAVRAGNGFCVYHEGGGIYVIFTEDKIVRTKYIRLFPSV